MFGPSLFALVLATLLCAALRTFPQSSVLHVCNFTLHVVLGPVAANGSALLTGMGPVIIIFAIWRAWLQHSTTSAIPKQANARQAA